MTHSAVDQRLAEALVDALRLGANVPDERIFCSSVEGLGIPTGAQFLEYLREQLQDTDLVVPLVTPAYLDSTFCAYELGAAWVREVPLFPLAVPPVDRGGLPGPLGATQVAGFTRSGLNECLRQIVATTPGAAESDRWESQRDRLLQSLSDLRPELAERWAATPAAIIRRRARHGAAAEKVHEVFHSIRDAAFLRHVNPDGPTLRSLLAAMQSVARSASAVFTTTAETSCRVTIKQLLLKDDVLYVLDLKRSHGRARRDAVDRVEDNTDFEQICSGSQSYFWSNDLPALTAAGSYRNSHVPPGAELPYRSTIVWPIRKLLDDPSDADAVGALVPDQDILGFLCVDAQAAGAFSEDDVQLGAAVADTLYVLLKPFVDPDTAG